MEVPRWGQSAAKSAVAQALFAATVHRLREGFRSSIASAAQIRWLGSPHVHGQLVPEVYQHMTHVVELGGLVATLGIELRHRILRGDVGLVGAHFPRASSPLGLRSGSCGSSFPSRRRMLLMAAYGSISASIYTEVLVGQQVRCACLAHNALQQLAGHPCRNQTIAVAGEGGAIPHRLVDRQAGEPAKQQVVVHLRAQQPLAVDRIEHLQGRGGDRRASFPGVDRSKSRLILAMASSSCALM